MKAGTVNTQWQKASFSEQGDNCLELAPSGGGVLIRESDDPGVAIRITPPGLRALLTRVKTGQLS
ncbi:DUF397 domain-containing protein [Streptomyces sp. L500]|uniref:DUF397 domain-containing protein n=1 Tax=Streptomyces abikoensis TaxID=97398 RepID=UPI0033FAD1E4